MVFAVLYVQRNKGKVGESINVPFLEPLDPRSHVGEIELAVRDDLEVDAVTVTKREFVVSGLIVDGDDVVVLLIFKSGLVAISNVAGNGVGLNVVVLYIFCKKIISRNPS